MKLADLGFNAPSLYHSDIVCVSRALCGIFYLALWQAVRVHLPPLYWCSAGRMKSNRSGNGEKYNRIISKSWAVNCIAAKVIYVLNACCLNTYHYSTGISQNSSTIIFPKQSDYFIEFLDYSRVIKPSLNFIATVSSCV